MNRATVLLILVIVGTLSGVGVHYTGKVSYNQLTVACQQQGGWIEDFDGQKVCVRKPT